MGYGFVIPDFQRHFSSFFTKEKKELDIECLQFLCRLPPWNDSTPFFPQKKPKKACILLHFCIIILFIEKTISYNPLVITTAARSRLIVIGSNGTRGFYADPHKTT